MVAAPELSSTNLVLDRPDTFQVHTEAYMSAEIFDAEMRRIFERTWVYVGHESQVPAVGDYRTTTIRRQPIIVSRHEDDQIYVLLNRCRQQAVVRALNLNALATVTLAVAQTGGKADPIPPEDIAELPDLGSAFNDLAVWRYHAAKAQHLAR